MVIMKKTETRKQTKIWYYKTKLDIVNFYELFRQPYSILEKARGDKIK